MDIIYIIKWIWIQISEEENQQFIYGRKSFHLFTHKISLVILRTDYVVQFIWC